MNSISRSSIRRALKTAKQIYSIRSPIILKKEKNKTFSQSWRKERIKTSFEQNVNSISFYDLNRI